MGLRVNHKTVNNEYLPMAMLNAIADVKSQNRELVLRDTVMSNTDNPLFAKYVSELISRKPIRKRKHYIKSGNLRKDLKKIYNIEISPTS